jgi:DNA topoisomerase-1
VERFPTIVDVAFTSSMEHQLDEVATGDRKWVPMIRDFFTPLEKDIKEKMKEAQAAKDAEVETTDKICDKCQSPMIVKRGRFGKFVACSNFPTCKNVLKEPKTSLPPELVGRPCPKDEGPLIFRNSRFGKFIACSNFPKCRYTEKIPKDPNAAPVDEAPKAE